MEQIERSLHTFALLFISHVAFKTYEILCEEFARPTERMIVFPYLGLLVFGGAVLATQILRKKETPDETE